MPLLQQMQTIYLRLRTLHISHLRHNYSPFNHQFLFVCFFFWTRTWFACTRRAAARPLTLKWTAHTHTSESPLLLYTQQKNANERKSLRAARAINSPTHTYTYKKLLQNKRIITRTRKSTETNVCDSIFLCIFLLPKFEIFFFHVFCVVSTNVGGADGTVKEKHV